MDGVEEFRFIMIGKTGSGKSTTGNTILGENKFSSELTFSSTASGCDLQRVENAGTRIEILDCPGLFNSSKSQPEISISIVKAVACMHPGPHAVLFIFRVGRFTAEEFRVYETLKRLFDDDIVRYIVVLITGGDDMETAGITLTDLLRNAPSNLLTLLEECKNRCLVFNNNAQNKKPQVENLLKMVRKMVAENNGKPYSCPKYSAIGNDLEKEAARHVTKGKAQYFKEGEATTNAVNESLIEAELELIRKNKERERQLEEEHHRFEIEKKRLEQELLEMTVANQNEAEQRNENEKEYQRQMKDSLKQIDDSDIKRQTEFEKYKLDKERLESELTKTQNMLKAMFDTQNQIKEEYEREKAELKRREKDWQKKEKERRHRDEEEAWKREKELREEIDKMKNIVARDKDPGLYEWLSKSIIEIFKMIF